MNQTITLVYVTGRRDPLLKWFVDSLCNQTDFDQRRHIQLVIVDGNVWDKSVSRASVPERSIRFADPKYHDADRRVEVELIINNRFDYLHIPPLPCVYDGPFRFTSQDWFAASNSRNTAFVVTKYPFVAMCDDLSVLGPIWFPQILHAAEHRYVVAGAYLKQKKMVVEDGKLVSFEDFPGGRDSRWDQGSDEGIKAFTGSMFGCSFGLPIEAALAVDGFEMATCGGGGEDYDFGIRLRRAGHGIFYNRNMLSVESEEHHHAEDFMVRKLRERRRVIRENLPVAYDSYTHVKDGDEKYMSDHVLLNRVLNEARIIPLLPQNLRGLREKFLATGLIDIPSGPRTDWRDNSSLSSSP